MAPGVLGLAAILLLCLLEPALWLVGLVSALVIAGVLFLFPARSSSARQALEADRESVSQSTEPLSAFAIADAVADPLIVFERQGLVAHANAAANRAFGDFAPGTIIQLRFRAPELLVLIERALEGGGAGSAGIEYLERLPFERLWRASVERLGSSSELFVLVLRDQSEVRRVDRMRADFIANASHELRTPLASVAGFIETLRGPARNDEKARERFLGIMHEQTGRMARLIDDLLSLSRIEMKAMPAPGETTDLTSLLARVIEANAIRASDAGVEIVPDLPLEPVSVAGDRDELFQVFENLIENACRYGHAGGRVDVSLESSDGPSGAEVIANVRDYGAGIAPEHIPRITERFYRVEGDGGAKGTGLGLSIVKHIVSRHNARLSIRSVVGEGTTFTVVFPRTATDR